VTLDVPNHSGLRKIYCRRNTHYPSFILLYISLSLYLASFSFLLLPISTSTSQFPSPSPSPSPSSSIKQKTKIIQNGGQQFAAFWLFMGTFPKNCALLGIIKRRKNIDRRCPRPLPNECHPSPPPPPLDLITDFL
jgi:hypothetical protein